MNEEYESNSEESDSYKNLCTLCGVDMGSMNPRQLCGKTHCYAKGYWWDQPEYTKLRPEITENIETGEITLRPDLAAETLVNIHKRPLTSEPIPKTSKKPKKAKSVKKTIVKPRRSARIKQKKKEDKTTFSLLSFLLGD